jgi:hypothetical protein
MMLQKRILHIFPSKNLKNSGVYKYNYYLNKIIHAKYECVILNENFDLYLFKQINRLFFFPIKIIYNILKKKINIIILPEENLLTVSLIKKVLDIKIIAVIHDLRKRKDIKNPSLIEKFKLIYLNFNYKLINSVDHLIVPSNQTKIKLKRYNKKKIIIPNLFEIPKKFVNKKKLLKKYDIDLKKILILNIGSNQSNKNLNQLINFIRRNKKFFLVQIGSKNKNKYKNILYLSNIKQIELDSFLKHAQLFISTTYFEGFGRPHVEARICKLPLLCLDNKINREVLGNSAHFYKNFNQIGNKIDIYLRYKKNSKFIKRYILNRSNIYNFQKRLKKIL